jgi:hypothetical protein
MDWARKAPARAFGCAGKGYHRFVLGLLALGISLMASAADAAYLRQKIKPAEREAIGAPSRNPEGPLQIIVSLGSQRLFVYDKAGLLTTSTVSTGVGGYPTPTGVFAVLDKEKQHYSNIYGGASMPFMQRLTMSGVALHSGMVTGRPASHGCIRLPHSFSMQLYKLTRLGVRVIIAPDAPVPADIAHARLFARTPPQPAEPETAPASPATGAALAGALDLDKGVATSRIYQVTAERNALLETLPVSVFVSKHEGKVFVRHGFKPLFDAPVAIRDPERLLGTHILTAVEFKDDSNTAMRWQAVSMPPASGTSANTKVSSASRSEAEAILPVPSGPPATAAEALDRIEVPPEALERISRMLSPGASLIISDHGFNREMRAAGTDFIVLTR